MISHGVQAVLGITLKEAQLDVLVELPIVVVEEQCFSKLLQGLYYFFVCVLDLAQSHLLGIEMPKLYWALPTCMLLEGNGLQARLFGRLCHEL